MTKAAYRGKFIWVLEGESMILGEARQLAAACYLEQKLRAPHTVSFRHKAERATTIGREALNAQSPTVVMYLLQQGHIS